VHVGRRENRVAKDFGRVYDEHVRRVHGFFGYRVDSRAEVEDLTQLTFERALRAWETFDESRAAAGTWLLAIARNLLVDHYRRDGSRPTERLEGASLHASAQDAEVLEIAPDLADALGELSEREREIIALRFGADLRGPEIAELTGLSLANVQQILSRSLRKLRAALAPVVRVAS
jgi:RNA polymerase sigma factor (sigma-70 family)